MVKKSIFLSKPYFFRYILIIIDENAIIIIHENCKVNSLDYLTWYQN